MKVVPMSREPSEFNRSAKDTLNDLNALVDDDVECLASVVLMKDGTAVTMCSEQPNWLTVVGALDELKHRLLRENSR